MRSHRELLRMPKCMTKTIAGHLTCVAEGSSYLAREGELAIDVRFGRIRDYVHQLLITLITLHTCGHRA